LLKQELSSTIAELQQCESQLADSKLLVATRERQIADIKVASVSTQQHRDGEALRSTQLELARVVEREQIGKGQLQATQNALEDALKENAKLKAAQVSLEELCNTENQQKESFKQRLIASNAAEAELLTQLDFAIKDSHALRTEGRLLADKLGNSQVAPNKTIKQLEAQIMDLGTQLTLKERECSDKDLKFVSELSQRKVLRGELGTALRETHMLRKERDEVWTKIPALEDQVNVVQSEQHKLLDEHVPLSTTHCILHKNIPSVLGAQSALQANVGAYSLREFAGLVSPDLENLKKLEAELFTA